MTFDETTSLATLKRYFGFSSFRPQQAEIIQATLSGRDVFALLPTGGGKSLCFQLPALMRPGLTVVISPLIALMKDQVDAMQAAGIPATFLNSSLSTSESRERLRGLHQNEYRLLYAAPERLMLDGMINDLRRWPVNLIAVDEAHCISEWGHDFRPEYRQLAQLRESLPHVPVMALTATATERVREDIVKLLCLREAAQFVASFNRPNLSYKVIAKDKPTGQVVAFLKSRPKESGIIYCQSRKTADALAQHLRQHHITARPYHAGLPPEERAAHQDLFLRDEIRVICATIAFGMGINKPNVRFVLHHDLPKNIEGYYQETGRAGRDGLPADCLLLFSAGDVVKQQRFIEEKMPEEQRIAREQLQQIVHYADSAGCRRSELLRYFGENYPDPNCGGCDNCLTPRETFDGTTAAQKFLSCVFRVRQKTGFGVGLNHIIDILTGEETDKITRWGHSALSTYGIGKEHGRAQWQAMGRELIRLGYLRQTSDKFSVLEMTDEGGLALKERVKVVLTKAIAAPTSSTSKASRTGSIACDETLFERLRDVRKRLADERNVPAYIVFSDVALRQMAHLYPTSEAEFMRVSGVGEKKLKEFGDVFLDEIKAHLRDNSRQKFSMAATVNQKYV